MKSKHIFWLSVVAASIIIFFSSIFTSSPINWFHFSLLFVVAIILFFLGSEYITKMNQMKIFEMMVNSNEFLFQTNGQSEFTDHLVQKKDLLGTEKIIQNFYRNYFLFKIQRTTEKEILSFLNGVARSLLYNSCVEVREALNQAIVGLSFERYTSPCAAAIVKANGDQYKYMAIVELIEMAFALADNKEQLTKLREGINSSVDIYSFLYSESEKEIINKFKMYIPESENVKTEKPSDLVAAG